LFLLSCPRQQWGEVVDVFFFLQSSLACCLFVLLIIHVRASLSLKGSLSADVMNTIT
jgi:hypothetical protein